MAIKNNTTINKKTTNGLNWFKNAAKSLGYSSSELIFDLVPSTSEFIKENKTDVKQMYNDFKDIRTNQKRVNDFFNANKHMSIARSALKNAMADIKSGNIYNKDRQDAIFNDEFDLGDDFSLDEDFSFSDDFTDDFNEETEPQPTKVQQITVNKIEQPLSNNSPMVRAIEKQSETLITAAQSVNDINIGIASNSYMLNNKISNSLISGIGSINDNISLLVDFQGNTMSKYVGASLKYYEDNLQLMGNALEELKKGLNPVKENSEQPSFARENPADLVFLSNGGLNIKEYMKSIKKNTAEAISSNMFLSPIKSMLDETDALSMMAASPLSFIMNNFAKTLLPDFLRSSMERLDKSFSSFFPAMLMKVNRLNNDYSNPFFKLIGEIFGINVRTKTSVDLSKYDRGSISYDGESKKALTEVIPGYLRKMLAVISGKEEVAFDYKEGRFKSVFSMSQDFKKSQNSIITNSFSNVMDEIKNRASAFEIGDRKESKTFQDEMEKFFVNLGKTNYLVKPQKYYNRDGELIDDLEEVGGFTSQNRLNFFRQLVMSLPKNLQLEMFGKDVMNARTNLQRYMEDAEKNPLNNNASNIFNGLGFDEHLKRKDNKIEIRKGFGLNATDKFDLGSLDYLRNIQKVLMEGIIVFPKYDKTSGSSQSEGNSTETQTNIHQKRIDKMKYDEDRYLRNTNRIDNLIYSRSQAEQESMLNRGERYFNSYSDISEMDSDQVQSMISSYVNIRDSREKENQKDDIFKWLGSFLKGNTQDKYNMVREKVTDILQKPALLLKSIFDKVDNGLYKMVFGNGEEKKNNSFLSSSISLIKNKIGEMGDWLNSKIFMPVKEALIGKDGIITKMKESDFYKSLKGRINKLGEYLFGKPTGENGKHVGGLFANTADNLLDMWDNAKYYFTGNAYTNREGENFPKNESSVFGQIKTTFKSFKDNLKVYLFGDKNAEDKDNQKGVFSNITNGIKLGFENFHDALFGPSKKGEKKFTFDALVRSVKERAPKSLAWGIMGGGAGLLLGGKLGLLGSLLLPGGPIGGAVVGTTVGFLSQSEKFKSWLFGEKDNSGNRIGGIINKSTQDFFKKNKAGVVGGAAIGALKPLLGFGLLPSFFLPGGPVGGAILGVASSLAYRSEIMQKFLFGDKDLDGVRSGGIFQKIFGEHTKGKNLFGNIGAGVIGGAALGLATSKFGLLGAMLIPGGPIGGAILGAASGIALSSERFKKALFGEFDEKTNKRKGGIIGKFSNWFKLEVQEPLKLKFEDINLNIQEWFTKSIANPFRDALEPLKTEFKVMVTNMKDMFASGWTKFTGFIGDVFEKHVGMPFGKFMDEKVMTPLKKFFSGILNISGKIVGGVLSAPFKGLNMLSKGLTKKQAQRGLTQYVEDEWADMTDFKGRRERGEKLGLFHTKDKDGNVVEGKSGVLGRIKDMYFNKESRDNARYGENGASYHNAEQERIAKRDAEQDKEISSKRQNLLDRKKQLQFFRDMGMKFDYENFVENSKGEKVINVSRFMDPAEYLKNKTNFNKPAEALVSKVSDLLNVPINSLISENGDIDFSNLDRKQKKSIRKAIQNGNLKDIVAQMSADIANKNNPEKENEKEVTKSVDETTDSVKSMDENVTSKIDESNNILTNISNKISDIAGHIIRDYKDNTIKFNIKRNKKNNTEEDRNEDDSNTTSNPVEKLTDKIKNLTNTDENKKDDDEEHSHASGKDNIPYDNYKANLHRGEMVIPANQANNIRKENGEPTVTASKENGPINSSNRLVNSLGDDSTKGMSKIKLLQRIAGDVRHIAQEVYGQLDGVGSNVFKIRNIIQKQSQIGDEDLTGSANKDRVGLWGRIKRGLYAPIDSLKALLMKPFKKIADTISNVVDKVKEAGKFLINIPKKILSTTWDITKEIGGVLKQSVIEIASIPKHLIGLLKGVVGAFTEVLKSVGPAIGETLMGAAKLFSGFMGMTKEALLGFGIGLKNILVNGSEAIVNVATEIGKTGLSLIRTIGKTGAQTLKLTADFMFEIGKKGTDLVLSTFGKITDVASKTFDFIGEKLLNAGTMLFDIVTSPLKFLTQSIGKLMGAKQEVFITGGNLDSVNVVNKIGGIDNSITDKNTENFSFIDAFKNLLPLNVQLAGIENGLGVNILSSPLLPVKIENINELSKSSNENSINKPVTSTSVATQSSNVLLPTNNLATPMLNALETFDDRNDKEEEVKTKGEKVKEKLAETQKFVSRKTANFLQSQKAIENEKEQEKSWKGRILDLLGTMTKDTAEHTADWAGIFGKKGLLSLALLALLPYIKDFIAWMLGKGNDSRLDSDGNVIPNSDFAEHMVVGGAKTGVAIAKKLAPGIKSTIEGGKKVYESGKKLASKVIEPASKLFNKIFPSKVSHNIPNAGLKTLPEATPRLRLTGGVGESTIKNLPLNELALTADDSYKVGKTINNTNRVMLSEPKYIVEDAKKVNPITKIVDTIKSKTSSKNVPEVSESVIKNVNVDDINQSKISKFISLAKDGIGKMVGAFTKKFPKATAALGPILGIMEKILLPQRLLKYLPRIAKGLASLTTSAMTLFTKDAFWGGLGLSTGFFEAAHLFKIDSDQVDMKMRLISSGLKGFLYLSWFFIIEILNDIVVEATNGKVDFLQIFATQIYRSVSTEEDSVKLENAQTDFEKDLAEYNEANGTNLSKDAWNDKVNKTVGQKVANAFGKVKNVAVKGLSFLGDHTPILGGVKGFFSKDTIRQNLGLDENSDISLMDRIKSSGLQLMSGATLGLVKGNTIREKGSQLASWTGDKLSKGVELGKKGLKSLYNNSALGGLINGAKNDDTLKKNFNISGEGQITNGMRAASGISTAIDKMSFGLLDSEKTTNIIYGMGVTIDDYLTKVKDGAANKWASITDSISKSWDIVKTGIVEIGGTIKDAASKKWTEIKDGMSQTWDSAKSAINSVAEPIKKAALEKWESIKSSASAIWDSAKSAISSVTDPMKKTAAEKWENIKTSASAVWDKIKEPLSDTKTFVGDTAKTVLKSLQTTITNIFDGVSGFFSDVFGWVKKGPKKLLEFLKGNSAEELEKKGFTVGGRGGDNKEQEEGGMGDNPNSMNNFAYYSQSDDKWAKYKYDNSPQTGTHSTTPYLKDRGCGPTSAAMVTTQLTGKMYTPPQMADIAYKGGYSTSKGTAWSYFDKIGSEFSMDVKQISPNKSSLLDLLGKNMPVILSGTRTTYGADDSPFTTAGHYVVATKTDGNKVFINDPRGSKYSKAYDLNKVMKEAKQGWGFKYNGGPLPTPAGGAFDYSSQNATSTTTNLESEEDLSIEGLFGKMSENFGLVLDNLYQGDNKQLTFGNLIANMAGTTGGSTSSNINLNFVPKNLQEAILKKTAEETIEHESNGVYTFAKNDINATTGKTISPSVGILQWRGNNAKSLLQQMYSANPNDPDAKYFANMDWNNSSPWSATQQKKLENYLSRNYALTKGIQDKLALNHITNSNLSEVYKYGVNTGKIKDPRSIAFLGDMANTGPALIKSFMDVYSPTQATGKSEFDNMYNQFLTKSYWGKRQNIYSSRLKDLYGDLVGWDPEQGGFGETKIAVNTNDKSIEGIEGGFGDLTDNISNILNNSLSDKGKVKVDNALNIPSNDEQSVEERKVITRYTQGENTSPNYVSDELLRKAISVLEDISEHTKNTTKGIDKLNTKNSKIEVTNNTTLQTTDTSKNPNGTPVVILNNKNEQSYTNPMTGFMNEKNNNKEAQDYSVAKRIAGGKIK